jgi:hypothetical protein
MAYGVEPWPRIEFYVRNGLVPRMPTPRQLKEASKLNVSGFGLVERMNYFLRHPQELFPTNRRKRALLRMPMSGMSQKSVEKPDRHAVDPPKPFVEKTLKSAYQFAPLRFVTACCFNPYFWPINEIAGTGLTIPPKNLISHVLHTPHYSALWDVQIIHADDGGLDQLEYEIELAARGNGMRSRLYRAMIQSMAYYDHLRELVPRVRRFDYPPPPEGYGLLSTNLVYFLNHATTL